LFFEYCYFALFVVLLDELLALVVFDDFFKRALFLFERLVFDLQSDNTAAHGRRSLVDFVRLVSPLLKQIQWRFW